MRVDRIASFAEAMIPSLAGVAGESIHRLGKVEARRRQIVIDSLFETFRDRQRESAQRLLAELFPSSDPLATESAVAAIWLIHDAFCAALATDAPWRRGLSAGAIASHIRTGMHAHIDQFSQDRGMNRELYGPLDIGFGDFSLEGGSHR